VYPVVFVVTGATKKVAAGAEVLRIPSAPYAGWLLQPYTTAFLCKCHYQLLL